MEKYRIHDVAELEGSSTTSFTSFATDVAQVTTEKKATPKERIVAFFKNLKNAIVHESLPTLIQRATPKVFRFPRQLERAYQKDKKISVALFVRGILLIMMFGYIAQSVFIIVGEGVAEEAPRNAFITTLVMAGFFLALMILSLVLWRALTPVLTHIFAHLAILLASGCILATSFTSHTTTFALAIIFIAMTVGLPVFSLIEMMAYFLGYLLSSAIVYVVNDVAKLVMVRDLLSMVAVMALCLDVYKVIAKADREAFLTRYMIEHKSKMIQRENERNGLLLLNILPGKIVEILQERGSQADSPKSVTSGSSSGSAGDIIHEYYADATIMFIKIMNFSEITKQLQASEVILLLNEVFSELDTISEKYNLYRIKTIGFTYMCTSGVPDPIENHVDNAVFASVEILESFRNKRIGLKYLDNPVEITIGMNAGPVVAGVIGSKSLAYDVWSDSVNIAARMAYYSPASSILMPQATYSKLQFRDQFIADEPQTIDVKGKGKIVCYRVDGKVKSTQPSAEASTVSLHQPTEKRPSISIFHGHSVRVGKTDNEKHEPPKKQTLLQKMAQWAKEEREDEIDKEFKQTDQIVKYEKAFNMELMGKYIKAKFMKKTPKFWEYYNPCCFVLRSIKMESHYRQHSHKTGYESVRQAFLYYVAVFVMSTLLEVCEIEINGRRGDYQWTMILIFAILLPIYIVMLIILRTNVLKRHFALFYPGILISMGLVQGGNLALGFVFKNSSVLHIRFIQGMIITAAFERVVFGIKLVYNILAIILMVIVDFAGYVEFGDNWLFVVVVLFICIYSGIIDDIQQKSDFFLRVVDYKKRKQFEKEQQRSKELLLNIIPQSLLDSIGKDVSGGNAKFYEMVGILFCDIHHFTVLAGSLKPIELVQMLSDLFSAFDDMSKRYDILKVKTIGDCYQCASGILNTNRNHLRDLANMALEMVAFVREYKKIEMRFGVHCGTAVGGIVGLTRFSYDLYGNTIDFASHMEQTGKEMLIHCSEDFYFNVSDVFDLDPREDEVMNMKNTHKIQTYFLKQQKQIGNVATA